MKGHTQRQGLFFCFILLFSLTNVSAEEGENGGKPPMPVQRAAGEVIIDGILDDGAWADALKLELKYEVRPGENTTPPVKTEMFITYDRNRLLVAFKCYDPKPSQIRARFSDRDRAWNDDFVGIVLDTFNDERRAYELFVNPFGIQIDAINDDVGDNYDSAWNAIWDSAARITDEGWQAEMAIPFNQLRFQAVAGQQIWGIDGIRSYPRNHRHHIGLFPRDRGNNSYLSQESKIIGFEGVERGENIEIVPTITSARSDERSELPDGDLQEGESRSDLGLTGRWGVTPNITLSGTLNPDFSQVEADIFQLDINNQFALFFDETRPFFLEGADYFNTPRMNLLHTRTIADPSSAVKVTGKEGSHIFGLFTAQDDVTNILIPGSQGSDGETFEMSTNSAVGRYSFDFGNNSRVGTMFTNRQGGDYYNRVVNLDLNYRLTGSDSFQANVAGSQTRYTDEMARVFELGEDEISDHALSMSFNHSARGWWTFAGYRNVGEDFRADLGFIPKVNYKHYNLSGARVIWGEENDWYNRLAIGAGWDRTDEQNGNLLQEEVETWFNFQGPKQSYFGIGGGKRTFVYEHVVFDQAFQWLWYEMTLTSNVYFNFEINRSDWVDFDHTRDADRFSVRSMIRHNFGRHLVISMRYLYQTLDVENGERLFTVHAPDTRITYQFNARMLLRAVMQYQFVSRDQDLYAEAIDEESKELFTQLLFSYKINPQTVLFLGYSDNYIATQDYSLTQAARTFFMKIGYAWLK